MRLILVDNAIKARTLWRILGDPEGTIVVPVHDDLVGLNAKTPFDAGNHFAPIYGVSDERAFQAIMRRVKSAKTILLGIEDPWLVNTLTEMIRGHGIVTPINTLKLPDLDPATVMKAISNPGSTKDNQDEIERGWRKRLIDRVIGDPIGKALKKLASIDWKPTLSDVNVLLTAAMCYQDDVNRLTSGTLDVKASHVSYDLNFPYMVATRLSHAHPAETLQHITEMIGHGLIVKPSQNRLNRIGEFCAKNFPGKAVNAEPKMTSAEDLLATSPDELLVPAAMDLDLTQVPTIYRPTYLDIWNHTVAMWVPSVTPQKLWTHWMGETRNLVMDANDVVSLGHLRSSWLISGRSYTVVTELGRLAASIITNCWPALAEWAARSTLERQMQDVSLERSDVIGSAAALMAEQRPLELPLPFSLCWSCRNPLNVLISQRRVRLVCQRSMCARMFSVGRIGLTIEPLLQHNAPRWCQRCSKVTIQSVDSDGPIITRACKGCGQTSQEQ